MAQFCCFSKRTSSAESRYQSKELETLAAFNPIKHFRHYLHGRHYVVFTDCNSLKASRTKAELTPRVNRWWSYMQSFEFEIQCRPGERLAHVDFLSRNPISKDRIKSKGTVEKHINLTEITDNWL